MDESIIVPSLSGFPQFAQKVGQSRVTQEEENKYLDRIVGWLRDVKHKDPDTKQESPAAEVEVVDTLADAEERARKYPFPQVVVFNSRGMQGEAKTFKKKYPRVKVLVFTGLIPDDEVVWVSKRWISNDDMFAEFFTGSW